MGFLSRIQLQDMDSEDERELDQAIRAVSDRHPSLVSGMRELSRIETRRLLRSQGLSTSSYPWEPYVVTMPKELMDVPHRYGAKLGKALYYMHTGKIIPSSGGVTVKAMTNAEFISPRFPLDRFQILTSRPIVARNGKSLEDQFSYRYALPAEGGGAGFLVQFRQSTAMLILAYEDEVTRTKLERRTIEPAKNMTRMRCERPERQRPQPCGSSLLVG